jgi:hypothetical protein
MSQAAIRILSYAVLLAAGLYFLLASILTNHDPRFLHDCQCTPTLVLVVIGYLLFRYGSPDV